MEIETVIQLYIYIDMDQKVICKTNDIIPNISETSRIGLVDADGSDHNKIGSYKYYLKERSYKKLTPEEFAQSQVKG